VTDPRRVLPGTTYLVTRRCTQREFLLKPSAFVNRVFKYVLAVAAERYQIRIHALCVMSNHVHMVLTDPRANLPEFARVLDGVVARALNAHYKRRENFWAPGSYSAVELTSPDDVVEKIAYTLANPASADLVEHGRQWPGLWSPPRSIGQPGEVIDRPDQYFTPEGFMPEQIALEFALPPGFESLGVFVSLVVGRLTDMENVAAARRQAKGSKVLGVRRVLSQPHTDRPSTEEQRSELNPRIAAGDRETRAAILRKLFGFLEEHREALLRYCEGRRNAVFPYGTYLMRVRFGVACASS
jgi:REP element-mobilizing transposase RayT